MRKITLKHESISVSIIPTDIYRLLRDRSKNKWSFLLESVEGPQKLARYSFLGIGDGLINVKEGKVEFVGISDEDFELEDVVEDGRLKEGYDPIDVAKAVMKNFRVVVKQEDIPRFFGGLISIVAYDVVGYWIDLKSEDDLGTYDAQFMFIKNCVVYDHLYKMIHIFSHDDGFNNMIKNIIGIKKEKKDDRDSKNKPITVKSNFTKEEFEKAVIDAKKYIYEGDIFQVVLSQRLETEIKNDPLDIYIALKKINPSPYMYYIEIDDLEIVGTSPEMLVRVSRKDGFKISTRPIAGTRPRGATKEEDEILAEEMLSDPKEVAEHIMLVDLGRNDVGKVSKFGTVKVDEFMDIEKYSHVQHIVSNVVGELRDDLDCFMALKAIFPAGTLSGAPKVRAMEIIDELEKNKRGIYGGGIGYFSWDGEMDFAIAIRTIVIIKNKAYVQAGAGIVADSDPTSEWIESKNKAMALLRAIEMAR